jgi:signal transduction histidine kinase
MGSRTDTGAKEQARPTTAQREKARRDPLLTRLLNRLGLKWLVLGAILAFTLGAVAFASGRVIELTREKLEGELGRHLQNLALTTATQIEAERALILERPGDAETRTYRNLLERLRSVQRVTGAKRLVIFDETERIKVDTQPGTQVGDPYYRASRDRVELARAKAAGAASGEMFQTPDGAFYKTGYAWVPVTGTGTGAGPGDARTLADLLGEEDKAAGVFVAVEGAASFFDSIDSLQRSIVGVGLIMLLILAVSSLVVLSVALRPLDELGVAARQIGRGQLDDPIIVGGTREFQQLATAMNWMRGSLAERDNQMRMMLHGIAHEVRNPLGGMKLYTELLSEDVADNAAAMKSVQRIQRELAYLDSLVNDFLDFARDKPGEFSDVELGPLWAEVLGLFAGEAADLGVRLEAIDENVVVRAHRDQLKRLFINMVRNALQAIEKRLASGDAPDHPEWVGRPAYVRLAAHDDGKLIRIDVDDGGTGIPEEMRAKIFEPFFTTREKGSGLGLALVQRAVVSLGGQVVAGEAPEGGARFTLTIPKRLGK